MPIDSDDDSDDAGAKQGPDKDTESGIESDEDAEITEPPDPVEDGHEDCLQEGPVSDCDGSSEENSMNTA